MSVPPKLASDGHTSRRAKKRDRCRLGDRNCFALLFFCLILRTFGALCLVFRTSGVFRMRAKNPRLLRKHGQHDHHPRESFHGDLHARLWFNVRRGIATCEPSDLDQKRHISKDRRPRRARSWSLRRLKARRHLPTQSRGAELRWRPCSYVSCFLRVRRRSFPPCSSVAGSVVNRRGSRRSGMHHMWAHSAHSKYTNCPVSIAAATFWLRHCGHG